MIHNQFRNDNNTTKKKKKQYFAFKVCPTQLHVNLPEAYVHACRRLCFWNTRKIVCACFIESYCQDVYFKQKLEANGSRTVYKVCQMNVARNKQNPLLGCWLQLRTVPALSVCCCHTYQYAAVWKCNNHVCSNLYYIHQTRHHVFDTVSFKYTTANNIINVLTAVDIWLFISFNFLFIFYLFYYIPVMEWIK